MANQSIYKAFERMWMHINAKIGNKADAESVAYIDTYDGSTDVEAEMTVLELKEYVDSSMPTFTLDGTTLTITTK
jgi:hypothetical protein